MADVVLERVEKRFGDVRAVAGIDLTVRDQEFLILVGPSGCGKTTTLRMIAGLEDVTSGDIRIGGRSVIASASARSRHRDGLSELRALPAHERLPEHVVLAQLARNARRRRSTGASARSPRSSASPTHLQRKPRQLSGGQRQRVAVGAALCRQAGVLLFDEPLSNLDAKLRVHMRTELKRLHQSRQVDDGLRHARSGRGDDDGRSHRHHERRRDLPGRHAAGGLRQPGQPVRGRLHRQPSDEFLRRRDRRRRLRVVDRSLREESAFRSPRPDLASQPGRRIVFGIRPEHISLAASGRPLSDTSWAALGQPAKVPATIDVVEPLGTPRHRHRPQRRRADSRWRPRSTPASSGSTNVDLWFDMNRAYLFDAETENDDLTARFRDPPASGRARLFEREAPLGYALVLPAVVYLALFIAYPFLMSIYLSSPTRRRAIGNGAAIGPANYSKVESYELVANDFVLATFASEAEAQSFADSEEPRRRSRRPCRREDPFRGSPRRRRANDSPSRDAERGRRHVHRGHDRASGPRLERSPGSGGKYEVVAHAGSTPLSIGTVHGPAGARAGAAMSCSSRPRRASRRTAPACCRTPTSCSP